jgi:hypothetical protein
MPPLNWGAVAPEFCSRGELKQVSLGLTYSPIVYGLNSDIAR